MLSCVAVCETQDVLQCGINRQTDMVMKTMSTNSEVELKLKTTPEEMKKLERVLKHTGAFRSNVYERALRVQHYFDTPDWKLRNERKLSLRIRKSSGGGYKQTIKPNNPAIDGVMDREEWQVKRKKLKPKFNKVAEKEARKRVAGVDPKELENLFNTHVVRRRATMEILQKDGSHAEIEIALDKGYVETKAGTREEVCEIELEVKNAAGGDPKKIIRKAAKALGEIIDVELETRSKPDIGFGLLEKERRASRAPRISAQLRTHRFG